ncbi:hypothetical protein ES703_90074 [subsurface metagenome]
MAKGVKIFKISNDVPAPRKDPQAGEWKNVEMEYIQVINYGPLAKDLTGWTIRDNSGVRFTFPQHQIRVGYIVKIRTGKRAVTQDNFYMNYDYPLWQHPGNVAYLYDAEGNKVDEKMV